jgi:hypothetical protein
MCLWNSKGCFRILKSGIQVHSIEVTDNIWLTCCALHNFLLESDGFNDKWQNGVPSDWEGELRHHNDSNVTDFLSHNFTTNDAA